MGISLLNKQLPLFSLGLLLLSTQQSMAKDGFVESISRWVFGYKDQSSPAQKMDASFFSSSKQIDQFLKDNPDTHWIDIRNGARQNISLQQANTLGVPTTITVETKDRPVSLYNDYSENGNNKLARGLNAVFSSPIPEGSIMRRQFLYPQTKPSFEMKNYSEHFDSSGKHIHTNGSTRPTYMLSEYEKGSIFSDKTKILEPTASDPNAKKFLRQAATRDHLAALAKALDRMQEPDVKKYPPKKGLIDRGDELLLSQWLIGSDNYLAKLIEDRRDKIGNEQLKAIEYKIIDYEDYSLSDLEPRFEPNMKGPESHRYQVGSKLVIPIPAKGVRAGLFPSPHYFQKVFVDAGISKGTNVAIPSLNVPTDEIPTVIADSETLIEKPGHQIKPNTNVTEEMQN